MNRRTFLRTGASAGLLLFARPAWARDKPVSSPNDAEILQECGGRIEKNRKGDGLVAVRNARGWPVPDVNVTIEQVRHEFLFGCNLFNFGHCASAQEEDEYRRRFAALFNYCTLGFYWNLYEPVQGAPTYDYTESVLQWTQPNGITVKGHPLVWDNSVSSPRWLPSDLDQILRLSDNRVRDLVSRFRERINIWDVVNEATHLSDKVNKTKMAELGLKIGQQRYVSEPLKMARAANSHTLLLVNDYRTDKAYYDLLHNLQQYGRYPFDVIGIQSHMHKGVWPLSKTWEICDTYSKLARPLHFTETTILSGAKTGNAFAKSDPQDEDYQAEKALNHYRSLFAHPNVQAITWWDFSDYKAWQGAPAGLLRTDMSPKPVYERLMTAIKGEWWTRLYGRTGPRGNFITRGFYGTYKITVEPQGGPPLTREVQWQRGQPNQFVFRI